MDKRTGRTGSIPFDWIGNVGSLRVDAQVADDHGFEQEAEEPEVGHINPG